MTRDVDTNHGNAAEPPVIAFFDIDNTLIRGATVYLVGMGAWRLKLLKLSDVLSFTWQQARFIAVGENMRHTEKAKGRTLQMLAGHTEAELRELGEEVYQRQIEARLWPEVVERAEKHLRDGHEVWLLSATAEIVAEVIAERLGFTGACATRFETVDGVFTGRLDGPMVHAEEKADAAARLANSSGARLEDCWAYSDSSNDLPLLSAVGHPVAVNADAALLREATTRGWPVLRLKWRRHAKSARPHGLTPEAEPNLEADAPSTPRGAKG
ncbi:HAD family hydrolase [Subtercola endophyticus]|uniref:HAD family hydrolase n=1 Tax=Subtercola endophyticus TaxID=2895559 RepID=UPI001E5659A2|nr:HAD-IB family hydrolase [Subtercola endophyticus]UFS58036.1 HAD-IB family hydrolase [Subtercola endophyticus]